LTVLITLIHIVICFILIVAVLLQSGKAADLAGAFGGVGSQTAFGPRGSANLLSKVTTISAILFMFTSMGLWILSAKGSSSVLKGTKEVPAAAGTQKAAPEATTKPKAEEKQPPVQQEKQKVAGETQKETKK
jgi:preprotein translocase subunit SecG